MRRTMIAITVCVTASFAVAVPETREGHDSPLPAPTDYEALDRFVRGWSQQVQGRLGNWRFEVEDTPLMVLADQNHDRMRIMTPVADAADLGPQRLMTLLEANFGKALDARYAVWQGQVWSVYLHPLAALSKREFDAAVGQVVQLRRNYGTTYTSSGVTFGGSPPPAP